MSKKNVLVVEDEELMRSILRQLLEDAGYNVFSADSAETALEIFPNNDIAVTLTDIKMTGMDGLELLDQIKSIDELQSLKQLSLLYSLDLFGNPVTNTMDYRSRTFELFVNLQVFRDD